MNRFFLARSPKDFGPLAQKVEDYCLKQTDELLMNRNIDVVELIDDVSNNLCSFLDTMECIKLADPRLVYREEATMSIGRLSKLMRQFNENSQIFYRLSDYRKKERMYGEKLAVCDAMLRDFKLYGITSDHFPIIKTLHEKHSASIDGCHEEYRRNGRFSEGRIISLLSIRHQLAELLGYKSSAYLLLAKNVIRSPEKVEYFLSKYQPKELKRWPNALIPTGSPTQGWRRLGNALRKIAHIFSMLFRVNCTVHEEYRFLKVQEVSNRKVQGYIYYDAGLDLPPSHFTLAGSKRTAINNCSYRFRAGNQPSLMKIIFSAKNKQCLSFSEIRSLLHELGHAFHGVLSNTDYQFMSGTRCALDFAEFPASLFERLAYSWKFWQFLGAPDNITESFLTWQSTEMKQIQTQHDIAFGCLLAYKLKPHKGMFSAALNYETGHKAISRSEIRLDWLLEIEHLITYGPSYYSYVLANYLADEFLSNSDKSSWISLRDNVLSRGGTGNPIEAFRDLRIQLNKLPWN